MKYAPYPKYKASGVEWLGDVPVGWENWKLSHAFAIIGSGTTPKSDNVLYYDGNIPWVTTSELREGVISGTKSAVTELALTEYSALRIFPKGTLLVAMYGATIGRMGLLDIEATCNQACCALAKGLSISPEFLFFWLQCMREMLVAFASGGGQPNLSQEFIKNIIVAAPVMQEQEKIILFLDQQCGHIDSLIEKKRRMLDLLDEKRRALITQAVTRGLDPTVPMKDSGVEWLGMVPVGWEVKRLKFLTLVYYGLSEPPEYQQEGVLFIRATDLHAGKIFSETILRVDPNDIPQQKIFWLKYGDIIVVRSGAYTGDSAIITKEFVDSIAGFDMILRCTGAISQFLQWALLSNYLKDSQIDLQRMRAAQPHLNADQLKGCCFISPPLPEQQAIADYLDSQTAALDKQRKSIETSIELLREYRASLITHAVTGKIDVRNFSPAQ